VKVPAKILRLDNIDKRLNINQSAILFFNEFDLFKEFYAKATALNEYSNKLHLFAYIQTFNSDELSQFQCNPWNPEEICNHIYFLIDRQQDNSIELVTTAVFQQPECRLLQLIVVNHFSKVTKKWKNRKFIQEKFRNFNGCELVIAYDDFSFSLTRIPMEIESSLNFTSRIVYIRSAQFVDLWIYQNSMRMIENIEIEGRMFKEYLLTHYLFVHDFLFFITRSEPYSIFEKALLPFDSEVWWWLIGFVVFGVMFIVVVSFMNQKKQNFVFGLKVKAPLLNMM
jgi:hypothetical protein